jgi:class 3 adenylate cyclase
MIKEQGRRAGTRTARHRMLNVRTLSLKKGETARLLGHLCQIEWLAGLCPFLAPRGSRIALMFTDIEGFTRYAASRGDRAAVELLGRHDQAVLPAIRQYRGKVLKRLGDGLMVAFRSPADAAKAALSMQRDARRGQVRLRIGIHAGEALARKGDLIGNDVNVASRIADRAAGGQILVSAAVRDAAGSLPTAFRKARPLVITGGAKAIPLFTLQERRSSR